MVSLSDIASKAGVTKATVSLALRAHPRISETTRLRVLSIAQKLGYVANLRSQSLARYRSRHGVLPFAKIAWIDHAQPKGYEVKEFRAYFQGASRRAKALGLEFKRFQSCSIDDNFYKLNYDAVMVAAPPLHDEFKSDFPWERFYALSIGASLKYPQLHLIRHHQYQSMMECLRYLKERGCQRVGFVLNDREYQVGQDYIAAFLAEGHPVATPRLIMNGEERLRKWIKRWSLDAVVVLNANIFRSIQRISKPLRKRIEILTPCLTDEFPRSALGMDPLYYQTGKIAVDLLVQMIQQADRGVPAQPVLHLVEGVKSFKRKGKSK